MLKSWRCSCDAADSGAIYVNAENWRCGSDVADSDEVQVNVEELALWR